MTVQQYRLCFRFSKKRERERKYKFEED